MRYLLDTHVLLWALFDTGRIRPTIRKILETSENEIYVSAVTFWEIALKYQVGRLELKGCVPDDLPAQVERMGFEILPMEASTLASSYRLPLETHKDPFDRMLAWISIQMKLSLITKDGHLEAYRASGLKTIW